MLTTERAAFESKLALLCAAYNVPMTPERSEAYWLACAKMQLPAFQRLVERVLSDDAMDKFPTVAQLWKLYRSMRVTYTPTPPSSAARASAKWVDRFESIGNAALFRLMRQRGGFSDESLALMLREKHRLASDFRLIFAEDPSLTDDVIRERFAAAFDRLAISRTAEEVAHDLETFRRLGHVQGFTADECSRGLP